SSGAVDRCTISSYGNTRVTLHCEAHRSGFVILADNYYPGWQAIVDEEERPILLANGFARAVQVEAGIQRVEFRYRPRAMALGLAISMAAMMLLAWLTAGAGVGARLQLPIDA